MLTDCSMVFLLLLFREIEVEFLVWCEEGNPERWMWSYCCSDIHVSRIGCCNKEFQSWLSSGWGRIWASLQREIGEYQSGQLESIQFLGICYMIFIFWGWIRWDAVLSYLSKNSHLIIIIQAISFVFGAVFVSSPFAISYLRLYSP